jgi:hypothetical protein
MLDEQIALDGCASTGAAVRKPGAREDLPLKETGRV